MPGSRRAAAGPLSVRLGTGCAAALLGAGLAAQALGASPPDPAAPRSISFHNMHTLETLTVSGWRDGAATAETPRAVSHVLRDHRNGTEHAMDPALLDLLVEVAGACGVAADYEVISGYRSPASNAAMHARSSGVSEHSLHIQGRAIDVRLAGCPLETLRAIGLRLARGGVGYYPGSRFVHLDTGRVRSWSG